MYVRLLDHNIEKASGITVRTGRFKGSVALDISGTIGRMTVNATELKDALEVIIRGWATSKPHKNAKEGKSPGLDVAKNDKSQRRKLKSSATVGKVQQRNSGSQSSAEIRRNHFSDAPTQKISSLTITPLKGAPSVAPPKAVTPPKVAAQIVSTLIVANNFGKSRSSAKCIVWSGYQDSVIRILSPEMAAKKLQRPLDEIHARRRALGL